MNLMAGLFESTLLGLVGLALVTAILLRRSGRYFRRTKNRPALVQIDRPTPEKPQGHHLDAPDAMRRWEVEMHEMMRDHSARLDNKIRILQYLLGEAEQAAARLEAVLRQIQSGQSDSAVPDEASRQAKIHAMAKEGLQLAEIIRRSGLSAEEVERILGPRPAD